MTRGSALQTLSRMCPHVSTATTATTTTTMMIKIIGTLRSNDADGNEKVKKNNRFY